MIKSRSSPQENNIISSNRPKTKKESILLPYKWNNKVIQWKPFVLCIPKPSQSESEVAQSYPTLFDPMDCSLPSSSVHRIFQAILLEWIAISFSRGSSQPRDRTRVSRIVDRCFTVWATREVQTRWQTGEGKWGREVENRWSTLNASVRGDNSLGWDTWFYDLETGVTRLA